MKSSDFWRYEWTVFVDTCYFCCCCCECMCVCTSHPPSFRFFWSGILYSLCLFGVISIFRLEFPFHGAGFVNICCLNLLLLLFFYHGILFSLSSMIERFAGFSSLGWHLWSLRVYKTSSQGHLAFRVFTKISSVILTGLPL